MIGSLNSFERASFAKAIAAAFATVTLVAAGCSRTEPQGNAQKEARPSAVDAAAVTAATTGAKLGEAIDASGGQPSPAEFGAFDAAAGEGSPASDADPAFANALPVGGKSIGHTSVVFKLKLEGGLAAAYKPRSKQGKERYRGEIAAYRLGRALGLSNVPPAIARSFSLGALRGVVGSEPTFDAVVPGADGQVAGALIPWIKGLDFLALDKDPWWERWRGWLARGGAIPDDQRGIAAQISTMIVFDYVTGNWDRWSGGNVGIDASKRTILYIDNDGAFFDPPPAPALARQLGILENVDRFSRRFVSALRAVDVRAAINVDPSGSEGGKEASSLLSARVFSQVEQRRAKALSIIDAKIRDAGEAETLPFE